MNTVSLQARSIDRLSLLPPELLSTIFDLVHDPENPLVNGLSRTLYPHVRRSLYRRTQLRDTSSFQRLTEAIQTNPSIACLVVEVDLPYLGNGPYGNDAYSLDGQLSEFLAIKIPTPNPPTPDGNLFVRFPFLASLSYSCRKLDSQSLLRLTGLESLVCLTVTFASQPSDADTEEPWRFPKLSNLSELHLTFLACDYRIMRPINWSGSLARMVDHFCPSLAKLTLASDECTWCDFRDFLSSLTLVRTSLESLVLISFQEEENANTKCDHLLPLFGNLRHLDLPNDMITPSLPVHLQSLRRLTSLQLHLDKYSPNPSATAIADLVRGPARIETLKHLVLHRISGRIGRRHDVSGSLSTCTCSSLGERELWRDGWSLLKPMGWSLEQAKELITDAKASGVLLRGGLVEMIGAWEAFELEEANRLIFRAHEEKSLREYIKAKSSNSHPRLPDINVDELDPEHLELVKIELPKEGWFHLTLE